MPTSHIRYRTPPRLQWDPAGTGVHHNNPPEIEWRLQEKPTRSGLAVAGTGPDSNQLE